MALLSATRAHVFLRIYRGRKSNRMRPSTKAKSSASRTKHRNSTHECPKRQQRPCTNASKRSGRILSTKSLTMSSFVQCLRPSQFLIHQPQRKLPKRSRQPNRAPDAQQPRKQSNLRVTMKTMTKCRLWNRRILPFDSCVRAARSVPLVARAVHPARWTKLPASAKRLHSVARSDELIQTMPFLWMWTKSSSTTIQMMLWKMWKWRLRTKQRRTSQCLSSSPSATNKLEESFRTLPSPTMKLWWLDRSQPSQRMLLSLSFQVRNLAIAKFLWASSEAVQPMPR